MQSIEAFTDDMSFKEFKDDDQTVSAVLRKFEVIGEATKRLPEQFKGEHDDIAGDAMTRMGDKVILFYQEVDHRIVWQTIQNRILKDKERLANILQEDRRPTGVLHSDHRHRADEDFWTTMTENVG